jgi:heme oxygenase
MRASPIHQRLRADTAELHQALEVRLDLLAAGLRLDRYRAVLCTFYGYYAALEPALTRVAASCGEPRFPLRARASLIARDLVSLGASPGDVDALPRCDDLPRLSRREHLAGSLYVVEGATLGAAIIARHVARHLGLTAARGAAFFAGDGDGDARGSRWRDVLRWLDEIAIDPASEVEIVAAARETFATLARWVDRKDNL